MRIDWYEVYRKACSGPARLTPREVDELTIAELSLVLDAADESERPPNGATPMDATSLEDHARKWRSMTPRQRLEHARNKR